MDERKEEYEEQALSVLNDMLECNTCQDLSTFTSISSMPDDVNKIEKMMTVLPGINYVKNQMLNYLFSNGLTTGSINQDITLDAWLYHINRRGATNYATIREAIGYAATYGECGLRWVADESVDKDEDGHEVELLGDVYIYMRGTYAPLLYTNDNSIDEVVGYVVKKDGTRIEDTFDYTLAETGTSARKTIQQILSELISKDYLILDASEFVNIRNDVSQVHGDSPLLSDKLRLSLLIKVYERLNYDIEYDGPGRIIVRPKEGYVAGDTNEVSTSEVVNASRSAQARRNEKAKEEVRRVAKEIKSSTSDAVIVLSNAFSDNITHLERVTKATEFFDWIENEGVILAQAIGMSPSLLEVGNISGNVSMEKIIDNSMINNIIPLREQYAIQFSDFVASHIGVAKVYFDKYEMQQAEDENETRKKIADIMVQLGKVGETELIKDLAEMIKDSLYDENNELRSMSVVNDKSIETRKLAIKREENKDGE